MIFLAALCVVLAAAIVLLDVRNSAERKELRDSFNEERQIWIRERRDLNNRIQVPEAAPYLAEDEPGADRDDLPVLPEFTVDEDEMARAKHELEQVGYTDGPAA